MESGFTLVDKAAEACGSRYKLAQLLHEDLSFLGKVAKGKAPCPPSLAARLAVVAGLDAHRALLATVLSQEKNAEKRADLARALGMHPGAEDGNGLYIMLT